MLRNGPLGNSVPYKGRRSQTGNLLYGYFFGMGFLSNCRLKLQGTRGKPKQLQNPNAFDPKSPN